MEGESANLAEIERYLGESKNETVTALSTKKEAIAVHKKLFDLSVGHLQHLKSKNLSQEEYGAEMSIIEAILADKLFFATGIDSADLDTATEKLNLE
jgi:hypothetical protein